MVKSIQLDDNYRVFKCKDMSSILTNYFTTNHNELSVKVKSDKESTLDINALMESLTINPFLPQKKQVTKKNKTNFFGNNE